METRKLQAALNDLFLAPDERLVVDGIAGPKTIDALKRYQTARGLVADGIAGPRTEADMASLMGKPVEDTQPALLTGARVKEFAPNALPSLIDAFDYMRADFEAAGLTTPLRVQHFLAQVAVETKGLTRLEENLNYTAKRLTKVWPSRFPTIAAATPYAHNPEALANKVYGGRMGNVLPGDGWRFRGSGPMMLTGRYNFRIAGYEDNPEALRTAGPGLKSALKYWKDHNINAAADADDVRLVRKIINGGSIGLEDAKTWLHKAKRTFV